MNEQQPSSDSTSPKKKISTARLAAAFVVFLIVMAVVVMTALNLPADQPAAPTQLSVISSNATRTLPPTFTPAPTEVIFTPTQPMIKPSLTPTSTATFITLPTQAEAAAEPTTESPELTQAPGTEEPEIACGLRASAEGVVINQAPFVDMYRILPTMQPGVDYKATINHPTYFAISYEGQPAGWVDYRLLAVDYVGDSCEGLPLDQTPITDFPGLCFFEASEAGAAFSDPELTEPSIHSLETGTQMVVLHQHSQSYFTAFGHAGPSFYVDAAKVNLFGDCGLIPRAAASTINTWLWTAPGGELAAQRSFVTEGMPLYVQGEGNEGPAPPGIEGEGNWYLVLAGRQEEENFGWIWGEYLEIE